MIMSPVIVLVFCGVGGMTYWLLEQRRTRAWHRQRLSQIGEKTEPEFPSDTRRNVARPTRFRIRQSTRQRQFNAQIPDALRLIAAALRAGHSPARAIQMLAEEMPPPASDEFSLTMSEIGLGMPTSVALARMSARVRCPDWDLVAAAVTTQMQTGGNLAELLERIAETVRERVRVQGEIRTLTAEGRLSAVILIALPPLLACALMLRDPLYFQPLLSCPLGHELIAGAMAGQALGTLTLRRMLTLEG